MAMFFCVRLFVVSLEALKFVKSFAKWQYLAVSEGLSHRLCGSEIIYDRFSSGLNLSGSIRLNL